MPISREEALRLRVKVLGWGQHLTASKAKVDRAKLSLWENRHVELTEAELRRLERALLNGMKSASARLAKELEAATEVTTA